MVSRLHYITQATQGRTHAQNAALACEGGIKWVQLRIKDVDEETLKEEALRTQDVCIKHGAQLIINDYPALAKTILADGVHLGKRDMALKDAILLLEHDFILGATVNNYEDILNIDLPMVDYLGLGPYRFTSTKENLSPIIGLQGYETIQYELNSKNIQTPIIAIGGIHVEDIGLLKQAGVFGIAISSAINMATNPTIEAARFMNEIHKYY